MKNAVLFVLLGCFLAGCARQEVFETVDDEMVVPAAITQVREMTANVPDTAVAPVLESGDVQVYYGDGYEIILETMGSGDLDATIRSLSGYGREKLTVLETVQQDIARYDFVWACAGETGDRLGRAAVLDDGNYHYCMTVLRDASGEKSQIVWEEVFASFCLI